MALVIRLLLGLVLLPFRALRFCLRRLYLVVRGYNVLRLKVHGSLPDQGGARSLLGMARGQGGPSLLDVTGALDRARRDPRVKIVLVELGPLALGLARAEELREAFGRVRDAGKRVIVYLEECALAEYAAALGASEIVLSPGGALNVTGIRSEVLLVRGLLDRVGVRAWFSARGKYKSMRETFTEPHMTPANREMTEALVGDLYDQVVLAIAASRRLDAQVVREHLDRGPFMADDAKELGLVDRVLYLDEIETALKSEVVPFRPLELRSYMKLSTHLVGSGRPTKIALLEVKGHIKSGGNGSGPGVRSTGSRDFVRDVKAVADDPRVRAILLRVDSPGGSALSSDVMWRALSLARAKKPIVVSMVDVAASGGYFVAGIKGTPILASGATLTGSIGVVGGKFELAELYEKLGIRKEVVARGLHSGFFSESRGLSDEEVEKLERDIDAHYRHFVARMAEGREKSVEEIDKVAQGRVYTGRQALAIGLVDETGGLVAALAKVRSVLGLAVTAPLALAGPPSSRRRFPVRLAWGAAEHAQPGFSLPGALAETLSVPLSLAEHFSSERVLALMPFSIRFG
jgi:protease-4